MATKAIKDLSNTNMLTPCPKPKKTPKKTPKPLKRTEFKRKPTKKRPPTESQIKEKLRKKCVAKAKEISKKRDDRQCKYVNKDGVRCSKNKTIHSHHIFHEGLNKAMSADVDNLITLCPGHHQGGFVMASGFRMKSNDNFNFHNSPTEAIIWLEENWKYYPELKERSRKAQPLDLKYWQDKWEYLKTLDKLFEKE